MNIRRSSSVGFANAQSVGIPWDCLVCCSNRGSNRLTLADRTLAATRTLMEGIRRANDENQVDFPEPEMLDQPPEEFQALFEGGVEGFDGPNQGLSYLVAILDDEI